MYIAMSSRHKYNSLINNPPPMRNTFVCNNHSKPWKWFAYCTSHFFSDDGPHYYRIIVHDKSHYTYAHMSYHNQCSELYLYSILGIVRLAWVDDPNHNGYHTIYQPIIFSMSGLLVWLDLTWHGVVLNDKLHWTSLVSFLLWACDVCKTFFLFCRSSREMVH